MKRGKLIVIDGTDGSGKATQSRELMGRLRKAGFKVRMEDFPQYGKKSAELVEEYLNGKYGSAKDLGPYIPSLFYAVDRFAARKRIAENLRKGYMVISNRYVTASMGHQGGKIRNSKARLKYFHWLSNLEYNLFKIPKPDLTIILHVPTKIAQKLVDQKSQRSYLKKGKKRDMHEADRRHLKDAENTYLAMAKKFKYSLIKCYQQNRLMTIPEVSESVWRRVQVIL